MNRLMTWIMWGLIVLNLLGYFMDLTWSQGEDKLGYFNYRIRYLGNFPYWLFAILLFLAINGIASIYYSVIKFRLSAREGNYEGNLPLPPIQLLGINLIMIPCLLVLFMVIRAIGL